MFRRKPQKAGSRRKVYREPKRKPLKPVKAILLLIKMRKKADVSCYMLATLARVDDRYLRRLEAGEARNPGRDHLIRLARALVGFTKLFDEDDVDRVLAAAGFAPAPLPK